MRNSKRFVKSKLVLKVFFLFALICTVLPHQASFAASDYKSISFYLQAHPDDWQLFRGDYAYNDLHASQTKVVFIYTTAGDAGSVKGWWETRERGAVASIRKALKPTPLTIDIAQFNDHPIVRYTSGNSVSYFLRLPDGMDGSGSKEYNNESLSKLRDSNKSITAVDKSTTYTSWSDFTSTLKEIMDFESNAVGAKYPWVNVADNDSKYNPGDHMDHKATSDAVSTFAKGNYNRALYVTYDVKNKKANIGGAALTNKKNLFYAYANEVYSQTVANGDPVDQQLFEDEWYWWGNKSYSRNIKYDQ
ncbi:PIG-L family deacetylase [Brevibacillus halotolerans]|uniref:PIG-L family deacetylase n=1 Tax=Brevibacillus TaxID=55080 RepID=UPI00215BE06B|nr:MULTISPECIES: PIG-L family deacetylase [Brevibacillus]MCR8963342.1 PIG-L family deacetylase [Brevibacillus laterosporus]MCZ0835498.1 PIG-L family deacetylase [Brevibacillus halotolerans]